MRFTLILITAIMAGCQSMYPPSPWTHDQNPGPMAESTVTYESVDKPDEPTPIHDDKHRFTDVRIRTIFQSDRDFSYGGGCVRETYSGPFDAIRATSWTFKNSKRSPHAFIGNVSTDPEDDDPFLDEETEIRFRQVSSSQELMAWFGAGVHDNAHVLQLCMESRVWYPAATGGNFVVQDPTRRGPFILQHTAFQLNEPDYPEDQPYRGLLSWRVAVQQGIVQCERRTTRNVWQRMTWKECLPYKPDYLVFFHVRGEWI